MEKEGYALVWQLPWHPLRGHWTESWPNTRGRINGVTKVTDEELPSGAHVVRWWRRA